MNNRGPAQAAAIVGGLLWIAYAIFLYVRPGDTAATYLTGAAALAGLAFALLATVRVVSLPVQSVGRFGVAMAWMALLAAAAAAIGRLLEQDAFAANAMVAAEVLLAVGVLLVAVESAGAEATTAYASALFVVGATGLLGLMAQALAATFAWMLPIYAALVMAVYGLAWVQFGGRLSPQP